MAEYEALEYQVRTRTSEHAPLVMLSETDDIETAKRWANGQWNAGKWEVVILSIEKTVVARKVRDGRPK